MYKIQLADGTEIEFQGTNGNNYIVGKNEMDVSVFTDENLKTVTVTNDEGEMEVLENLSFVQQQQQLDGNYYICFRAKTKQELTDEKRDEKETAIELALVEVYEMMIEGSGE